MMLCIIIGVILIIPACSEAQVTCHVEDFDSTCGYTDTLLGWHAFYFDPEDTLDFAQWVEMGCESGRYVNPGDPLNSYIGRREIATTSIHYVSRSFQVPKTGVYEIHIEIHGHKDSSGGEVTTNQSRIAYHVDSCESFIVHSTDPLQEGDWIHFKLYGGHVDFRPGTGEDFCIDYVGEAIPTLTEWGLIIFGVVLLGFITWVFLKRRKVAGVRA
jgi:hypothetical protein